LTLELPSRWRRRRRGPVAAGGTTSSPSALMLRSSPAAFAFQRPSSTCRPCGPSPTSTPRIRCAKMRLRTRRPVATGSAGLRIQSDNSGQSGGTVPQTYRGSLRKPTGDRSANLPGTVSPTYRGPAGNRRFFGVWAAPLRVLLVATAAALPSGPERAPQHADEVRHLPPRHRPVESVHGGAQSAKLGGLL